MKYTNKDTKNFPRESGVYKIYFKNSNSNKVYIGSASGKLGF
jgi:excinuclease UvrABC nuclease subunit